MIYDKAPHGFVLGYEAVAKQLGVSRKTLYDQKIDHLIDGWRVHPLLILFSQEDVNKLKWWQFTRQALAQLAIDHDKPKWPQSKDTLDAWFEEAYDDQVCPKCENMGVGDHTRMICPECGEVEF